MSKANVPVTAAAEETARDIIAGKKPKITFRTPRQEEYWNLMDRNEITFCAGPAGSGKTHLSVTKAVHLLFDRDRCYDRIIIIKPAVEAEEKLGFLPGGVEEKLAPYTFSTLYLLEKLLGRRKVNKLLEQDYIRVMALAYLRGVNIDNSILIFEEAQNCTPRQMKTLLTRIGENSRFIISGDLEQSDRYTNFKDSGLHVAMFCLGGVPGIGVLDFTMDDIVRNPIIGRILLKLNGDVK